MRHRLGCASLTGFGNPSPDLINDDGVKSKEFGNLINDACKEAYFLFFKKFGYCDGGINQLGDEIRIGVEPAYQYEEFKMITVCLHTKQASQFMTGYAWGYYGSDIAKTTKFYREYRYNSKFIKFVDKWQPIFKKEYDKIYHENNK